jgi:hypothetical protein
MKIPVEELSVNERENLCEDFANKEWRYLYKISILSNQSREDPQDTRGGFVNCLHGWHEV